MSKRVLVVDDSPVMRELLAYAARLAGDVKVDHAEDGVAAMQLIRASKTPYDLVFVDLNMPIMDGMKLLSFLKSEGEQRSTMVAVVTTEGSDEAEQKARSLGAKHFLRKPVARDRVVAVLREALTA